MAKLRSSKATNAENTAKNSTFLIKEKLTQFKSFSRHSIMHKPINAYSNHEYATPLFVLRETLAGFTRHNILSLSASLSFYALFALIPLILLISFC